MAKIFYAVSGEGHGHGTRSAAVIAELNKRHTVIGFSSKKGVTSLRGCCQTVYEIPGFSLSRRKNKVSFIKTILTNSRLLMKQYKDILRLRRIVEDEKPDLIISDFEPFMCRAAGNVPVISIDNQQLLLYGNIPVLSSQISNYMLAKNLVRMYYTKVQYSIATYFCKIPLKANSQVTLVDPIIREEVIELGRIVELERKKVKSHHQYIVVYVRSNESAKIVEVLRGLPYEFHFFGSDMKSVDNIISHGKFSHEFLSYVAKADAIICTAGLSLICEALYLKKPVFAIPERKDFEQFMNAYMIAQHNFGSYAYLHKLEKQQLLDFLSRLDSYERATISPNGAKQAAVRVDAFLSRNASDSSLIKIRKSTRL
jgi:uncharacterized protein (TIGR00661 family)